MANYEEEYLDGLQSILSKGKWVYNERTGIRCLTLPRMVIEYNLNEQSAPLLTTRPSYPVSAVAEILGYLRRYEWAQDFADIGSSTWFSNANETPAWLSNANRKGEGHIGKCYGAAVEEKHISKVLLDLSKGKDDRGLILNWWQPHVFDKGCLRPCLSQHAFSIIGDEVNLNSFQRSCDYLVGKNFNAIQVYFLGMLAAKLSGKQGGTALHVMQNVHIYENHLGGVEELLSRKPTKVDTTFKINGWVNEPIDITCDAHAREYFTLDGYKDVTQPKIEFEMAV